jgi:hypothetical protein
MGWFPGYAINLETGERLNMAFGEDSWLNGDNGRDMLWNPDTTIFAQNPNSGSGISATWGLTSVFGGKHYIYVFAHNNFGSYSVPAYDADYTISEGSYWRYAGIPNARKAYDYSKGNMLDDIMWVNIPLLNPGHHLLETDAKVHLSVTKPYDTNYGSTYWTNKQVTVGHTTTSYPLAMGSTWRNNTPQNHNYPMYSFSTDGLGVDTNNPQAAKNALQLIRVVPNPYYAYSGYETDRLDTRVRITNLPPVCTISIFTVNGTLIRVIDKNTPLTYYDWNLQNQYNVPIASGMYIMNVSVPNVGQVTLKWFGVTRPTDLNSY